MSEDDSSSGAPSNGKTEKESDFEKDLKKGPLQPGDEDLFNFLDSLFNGEGEFPERIEVRLVKGRNKDQYGQMIKQYPYKSTSAKPSRERVVMMCNEIIHRIRVQTDVLQKETTFAIGAIHHARSDDYYEVALRTAKPRKTWKNGDGAQAIDGNSSDDDEDMPFSTRYNLAHLTHQERLFGLIGGMVEGLIDRSDRQAAAAQADAEQMRARYIELLETNLKLVQAKEERDERVARSAMWRENVGKGLDMAWKLLPPMVGSLTGKNGHANWTPGTVTTDSYTLAEFFKTKDAGGKLTQGEFNIIFGELEDGKQISSGILSIQQGQLLGLVASTEANPEQLDMLLPGGPLEITGEQVQQILQSGIPIDALAPIKILLDVRVSKREAKQQKQGE